MKWRLRSLCGVACDVALNVLLKIFLSCVFNGTWVGLPSRPAAKNLAPVLSFHLDRGALILVKRRSLARRLQRLQAFVRRPTGLRYLPRLLPNPRLDMHPRRPRNGFPSPVASFRSCPTVNHAKFAVQPLSDRAPSGIARLPRTPSASSSPSSPFSSRSSFAPSAPDHRPHAATIIAIHQHPIDHPKLTLRRRHSSGELPRHLCTVCSYLGSITTAALTPCFSFCPALCSCPPPQNCALTPPHTSASACTHPATRATEHSLMAVATMPFNPDVLASFHLAYPSRAGTEI